MRTYEEALKIWGARQLGVPEDTEGIFVEFDFDISCWQGCETCGPEHDEEFAARVYQQNARGDIGKYKYVDFGNDYSRVIRELFAIAGEDDGI